MTTSKWSEDLARGMAHPDSHAARQSRIATHLQEALQRQSNYNGAVRTLTKDTHLADDVVAVLHAMSYSLTRTNPDTAKQDVIKRLDLLADYLQFGEEA